MDEESEGLKRYWAQYLIPKLVKLGEELFPDTIDLVANDKVMRCFQWNSLMQHAKKQPRYNSLLHLKEDCSMDGFLIGYFVNNAETGVWAGPRINVGDVAAFVDSYEELFPHEDIKDHFVRIATMDIGEYTKEGMTKRFSFDPPGNCDNRYERMDELWETQYEYFNGKMLFAKYFIIRVPEPSTAENAIKLAEKIREKRLPVVRNYDEFDCYENKKGRFKGKYQRIMNLMGW